MATSRPNRPPLPKPVPRTKAPEAQPPVAQDESALQRALETIFADGNYGQFPLRDGRLVVVQTAKTKHLTIVTEFFKNLIGALNTDQVAGLLAIVTTAQEEAIRLTGNPKQLSLELIVAAALGVTPGDTKLDYSKVLGNGANLMQLILGILGPALDTLGASAARFTNLTPDEYGELDLDEGAVVLLAVFMANYSFFTQTLPPVLQAFLAAWAAPKLKAVAAARVQ
jgi:hypothetical protein